MKRIINLILVVAILLGNVNIFAFAAENDNAVKLLEDYPEVAYALDANDKKSIEAAKLTAVTSNTNENKYSGEWRLKDTKILQLKSLTDIAGFETIEFYLFGDEKHPATLRFTVWANDPNSDGSDYYNGGDFEVKPGWNKYEFSLSAMKEKAMRTPKPLNSIDGIYIYASGWELDSKNDFENTVLYLDSVKLTRGEKVLLDVVVPEEDAGTAKYFEHDFEAESKTDISGIAFAAKSNKIELAGRKGSKYLSIMGQNGGDDCFIDINVKYATRYTVIKGDFMVEKLDTGVQLIVTKDSSGGRVTFMKVTKDGTLVGGDAKFGKIELGKWFNIIVCADFANHVYDVYIDGELAKKGVKMDNQNAGSVTVVRSFVGVGGSTLNVDNLAMFDGKTPGDYEKAIDEPKKGESVVVPVKIIDVNSTDIPAYVQVKSNAVAEVADAVCLKVNSPFALVRHVQMPIDANNREVAPFVINGRTLVPVRFISEAFGAEVAWDDATRTVTVKKDSDTITLVIGSDILNKNGTDITIDVPAQIYNDRTMLPLRAVTENLGKKVFWDDLGLIIISDNEINFTKENDLDKMLDIMSGFIYERPGREKIKKDILQKTPDHPRILATAEDFARIRGYMDYDVNLKKWVDEIIATADGYVKSAPTEKKPVYAADEGGRLANDYGVQSKAFALGMAYQLTGEKKYADAMWHTLEPMCDKKQWEHWHPGHFLNAAYVMRGVSIAYDWMYDAWSPEQKEIIENALYDCGIEDSITAYYGANDYLSPPMDEWHRSKWWKQGNNWNAICNAGVVFAGLALATHEQYGDLAIKAIDFALNGVEVGLRCYAPDGGYEEGPGYWADGTGASVNIMAALSSATGTSYGLSDAPGFGMTYATPLYSESKQGMFNYSDTTLSRTNTSTLFWFGKEYGNSQVNGIRYNELLTEEKESTWRDVLYYDADNIDMSASLMLDYSFYLTDTLTMRSSWTDLNQVFVGLRGGNNAANHANLDSGTFVLDALGTRWFMDLGRENYNLPGYWSDSAGGKRWNYYSQRAEGHNTFVINPGLEEDQIVKSVSPVVDFVSKPRGAYGKIDLTSAYEEDVVNAMRGGMLTANRKAVVIQDEITMKAPSEFYWFAHTKAEVEISADGRSAILKTGDKKLHCQIVSDNPDFKFEVMDAVSLPTSPVPEKSATQKENSREGIRKLVIHSTAVESVNLAVVFVPLAGSDVPDYSYSYTPLDNWSINDGNIITPKLEALNVEGALIEGFGRDITAYEVVLPYGTTQLPRIDAVSDGQSSCQVIMPDSLPGIATIKVANNEDPSMYSVYNVFMKARNETELTVSGEQEGNGKDNCMDKDLSTRWAVEGESWGIFDFAVPKKISSVWLATWKADQRKLIFDIEVSTDGENFTQVWSGQSSTDKDELEEFKIPEGTYKAIKLVLHGTTTGSWNSILEVEFK